MGWIHWCHHLWQIKLATYFSYASFPKSFRLISLSNFFYFPSLDVITHTPGFSSFVSAHNSQIYVSSYDMLQASELNSLKTLTLLLPAKACPPLEYLPGTQMWQTPSANLFFPTFLHMAETTRHNQATRSNSSLNCSEERHLSRPSYLSSCHE